MKTRLDVLLAQGGYAPSREKARLLIMEGNVYVNGQKEDKPGTPFDETRITIEVRGKALPYVSRGGLKLEKALQVFPIDLHGRTCMDIGSSTGGFTDCMLQNGASLVYAVDVGYGQLDWKLRSDERVICMEKTNFRYLTGEDLGEHPRPDFASVDVSFISLSKILPNAIALLEGPAEMVALIKPQFEAGREKVGKKGVVRDSKVHEEVLRKVLDMTRKTGFRILGLSYSPIRGPEGNIEYLMHIVRAEDERKETDISEERIRSLVEESHGALK